MQEQDPGSDRSIHLNDRPAACSAEGRVRLWYLLLVAAAVRALYLFQFVTTPLHDFFRNDHLYYREWGLRIAGGQMLSGTPFEQGPLYAYFVGALFRLFGPHEVRLICFQFLAGLVTVALIWWCARCIWGSGAALGAGILAALYGPLVFYECMIMKSFLEPLLVMISLAAVLLGFRTGNAKWHATAGFAVGLACLVREVHILILPLFLFAAWHSCSPPPPSLPKRLRTTGALLLGCIFPLTLSFSHNMFVAREPTIVSSSGGQNLYLAFGPYANGYYKLPPFFTSKPFQEHEEYREEAFFRTGIYMTRTESSRYWLRETIQWALREPSQTVLLVCKKAAILFNDKELPDSENYSVARGYIPLLDFLPSFGWIAGLGFLGVLLLCKRRGAPRIVVGLGLVLVLEVLLTFNLGRYRVALSAMWLLYAGVAVAWLSSPQAWSMKPELIKRLTAICAVILVTILVFVSPPGRPRTEFLTLDDVFQEQAERASVYQRNLDSLKAKLMDRPRDPHLLYEWADSLDGTGRLSEAVEAYERVLAVDPNSVPARSRLITVYSYTGQHKRALEHARELASRHQSDAESWLTLGRLLVGNAEARRDNAPIGGILGEATTVLSHVLAMNPRNTQAHLWLGRLFMLAGKEESAIREFEEVLHAPDSHTRPREFIAARRLAQLLRRRS